MNAIGYIRFIINTLDTCIVRGVGMDVRDESLLSYGVFSFMSPGWERRLVERKLGRKL